VSVSQQPVTEEPIIVHGPFTGDADRLDTVAILPPPVYRPEEPAVVEPVEPDPAVIVTAAPQRAFGLDAMRGLLLLAMNFAFTIPPWGPFPAWMYHMQVPPSESGAFVEQAGLTWRDMLYPGFLFTMATAIPITMSARLAKGMPYPQIAWIALRRAALLLLFSLIIGHVNPYWTHDYTKTGNIAAIFGLVVSFAFFVKPRSDWSERSVTWLRWAAWAGVIAVLFVVPSWYGQRFDPIRQDNVILSIAFLTVAGTLIWLFTRFNLAARLIILAIAVAGRTLAPRVDWIGSVWYVTPAPWLYQSWFLDLLVIVIPGTIVGDLLVRWMKRPADTESTLWSRGRLMALAAIGLSVSPILLVGLYERRYAAATAIALIALSALYVFVAAKPRGERDYVLFRLCALAAIMLVAGALLEPFEGGIKKDPQTLGYLVLMTGTAIAGLTSLLIIVDAFRTGERSLRPLVEIGQNPLFAYVVCFLGVLHVLWLLNAGNAFTATWPQATLRSVVLTSIVGFLVWLTTRKRLLWRA
jgi:hypothetical protein